MAVTTKSPKTLWWWQWLCLINSSVSAWCTEKQLQLSKYKSQVELNNHSLTCGRCCLLSDWYCLGVRTKNIPQYKYYPIPVNIAQYPTTQYQYRSNPIPGYPCTGYSKHEFACMPVAVIHISTSSVPYEYGMHSYNLSQQESYRRQCHELSQHILIISPKF